MQFVETYPQLISIVYLILETTTKIIQAITFFFANCQSSLLLVSSLMECSSFLTISINNCTSLILMADKRVRHMTKEKSYKIVQPGRILKT